MPRDLTAWHERICAGVLASPIITLTDPTLLTRLRDPAAECTFAELGFDSLARMELCIWLLTETGVEVTEGEVLDNPSVAALAAHLARRQA
jgi:acyl carrier protein